MFVRLFCLRVTNAITRVRAFSFNCLLTFVERLAVYRIYIVYNHE